MLKEQIEVAFRKQLRQNENDTMIAEAAAVAYEAPDVTHAICKSIVKVAVFRGLRSSIYDTALGPVMASFPDFAKDYAQALEIRLQEVRAIGVRSRVGEQRYSCPGGCGHVVVMVRPATMPAWRGCTHCMSCRAHFRDQRWLDSVMNETWEESLGL